MPLKNTKIHPWASISSLTLDPKAEQTHDTKISVPRPANAPTVDQPKATINANPAKKVGSNIEPQIHDPTGQKSPPSPPPNKTMQPHSDIKAGDNRQQDSDPNQTNDPNRRQTSIPTKGNNPKSGIDPNQSSEPKFQHSKDPAQSHHPNQGSGSSQSSDPKHGSDPKPQHFTELTKSDNPTIANAQVIAPNATALALSKTASGPASPDLTFNGTVLSPKSAAQLTAGTKTIPLEGSNRENAGPGGVDMGASGTHSPTPGQGNASVGVGNRTGPGMQDFKGGAPRSGSRLLWGGIVVAVVAMLVL